MHLSERGVKGDLLCSSEKSADYYCKETVVGYKIIERKLRMCENVCCDSPCIDKDWEAEIAKKMPETICLAKRLVREQGLKPRIAYQAAAQQCEIPEWKVEEELIRLALL